MAKISPVSSKYIIHATIKIDGAVDKPDVIGAIFGQTEGLLGSELELRELQRSGKIGRIEVNLETKMGKTTGEIIIPSSLDKAETSIIAAALEVIERIGPCNSQVKVQKIEDIRISKRNIVIERAKELLKTMIDTILPDSQDISEEVADSVRAMEIQSYGRDKLPAGPTINESEEIIVVEGRADVLNMLKRGFKNVIAIEGSSISKTIADLSKQKTITTFFDGDRGGDLDLKELMQVAEIDFVARAPEGKEVEELTKKEIHKALRSRVVLEQAKLDLTTRMDRPSARKQNMQKQNDFRKNQRIAPVQKIGYQGRKDGPKIESRASKKPVDISDDEKEILKAKLEDLLGTKGAFILDEKLNILGKVPVKELISTINNLKSGIYAVVTDDSISKELLNASENADVKIIVGMEFDKRIKTSVNVMVPEDF